MRFRLTFAAVCAVAAAFALAPAIVAAPPGRGVVRLVLARSTYRAGEMVQVTVVNGERSTILRGLCFTLARRRGRRWVTVRRTHGILVPCPSTAGVPQAGGSRQRVGLPLYDDLVPGTYRIVLRYRSAVSGSNLGNLKGSHVPSLEARLTVLAFRPGPEPHLSEARIRGLALKAAAAGGDRSPSLIQDAEGTAFEAGLVQGDVVFAWNWSYLIAVRGHFVLNDVSVPPGGSAPRGTVLTLVVDAKTGEVAGLGVGDRYPRLAELGPVRTDLTRGRGR